MPLCRTSAPVTGFPAIDHAAAERSQLAEDDRRQFAGLLPKRDPVSHDQILPRRPDHDTQRRAGQQGLQRLERAVGTGSHRSTGKFRGTRGAAGPDRVFC